MTKLKSVFTKISSSNLHNIMITFVQFLLESNESKYLKFEYKYLWSPRYHIATKTGQNILKYYLHTIFQFGRRVVAVWLAVHAVSFVNNKKKGEKKLKYIILKFTDGLNFNT